MCRGEERGDLVVGERDQVVAQDGAVGRADVFEGGVPGLGERDEDAAAVGGIAPARDPPPLLQALDEQRHRRLGVALEIGELGDAPRPAVERAEDAGVRARDALRRAPQEQARDARGGRDERAGDRVDGVLAVGGGGRSGYGHIAKYIYLCNVFWWRVRSRTRDPEGRRAARVSRAPPARLRAAPSPPSAGASPAPAAPTSPGTRRSGARSRPHTPATSAAA